MSTLREGSRRQRSVDAEFQDDESEAPVLPPYIPANDEG